MIIKFIKKINYFMYITQRGRGGLIESYMILYYVGLILYVVLNESFVYLDMKNSHMILPHT